LQDVVARMDTSIQILMKLGRENKLPKPFVCVKTKQVGELFQLLAKKEMRELQGTQILFEEPLYFLCVN